MMAQKRNCNSFTDSHRCIQKTHVRRDTSCARFAAQLVAQQNARNKCLVWHGPTYIQFMLFHSCKLSMVDNTIPLKTVVVNASPLRSWDRFCVCLWAVSKYSRLSAESTYIGRRIISITDWVFWHYFLLLWCILGCVYLVSLVCHVNKIVSKCQFLGLQKIVQ